jgi:AP-1 complex subunit gamma-1
LLPSQALTKELLEYLKVCDLEFKPDLTAKVCQLIQRYSPERRWYVDSMLQVSSACRSAGGASPT